MVEPRRRRSERPGSARDRNVFCGSKVGREERRSRRSPKESSTRNPSSRTTERSRGRNDTEAGGGWPEQRYTVLGPLRRGGLPTRSRCCHHHRERQTPTLAVDGTSNPTSRSPTPLPPFDTTPRAHRVYTTRGAVSYPSGGRRRCHNSARGS